MLQPYAPACDSKREMDATSRLMKSGDMDFAQSCTVTSNLIAWMLEVPTAKYLARPPAPLFLHQFSWMSS